MKTQIVVDKKTKKIICTAFAKGRIHDFRLWKDSKIKLLAKILARVDSGYQGLQKLHANTALPKKRTKKNPLTKEDKKRNKELSRQCVENENVIGVLKRFRIISERYRNRGKRFGLRFNLICGIYNMELAS